LRDRQAQRVLLQFFKPENYFVVRKVLLDAGRGDLIGDGCDALIPEHPPREALLARRYTAQPSNASEDHVHSTSRRPAEGYRPGRRAAHRRDRTDGKSSKA